MNLPVIRGATAATSNVGIVLGIHDIRHLKD